MQVLGHKQKLVNHSLAQETVVLAYCIDQVLLGIFENLLEVWRFAFVLVKGLLLAQGLEMFRIKIAIAIINRAKPNSVLVFFEVAAEPLALMHVEGVVGQEHPAELGHKFNCFQHEVDFLVSEPVGNPESVKAHAHEFVAGEESLFVLATLWQVNAKNFLAVNCSTGASAADLDAKQVVE